MPTWTWRTVTSTRREWEVPAAEPWGACLGDIRSAILAASMAYREQHGLGEDAPLTDDALRFKVTDDSIVISFTTEQAAGRRVLTPNEHDAAWHAIEGGVGEDGADAGTVLAAVLRALGIDAPTVADEQAASPRLRGTTPPAP